MRYASLRQGLVGAWCPSVSGPYGYRLPDLSGYGNHGTLTNMDPGSDWVVSGGKGALDFDGNNDRISLSSVSLGTLHTCSAWIRPNGQTNAYNFGGILGDGSTNTGPLYVYGTNATEFGYTIGTTGFGVTVPSMVGSWNNIISVRIGLSVTFYQNGVQVGSGNLPVNDAATVKRIGNRNTDDLLFYNGQLDDIRTYNRALSPSEIRLLASERGIGLKSERIRNRYPAPTPSRNRSSRFLGFPA